MRPANRPKPAMSAGLTFLSMLAAAAPAPAGGSRVISANPYDLTGIKTYPKVHALSYHIKKSGTDIAPTLSEALAETGYHKPIIISTDGTGATPEDVQSWAPLIASSNAHLEHYDQALHDVGGSYDIHQLESEATWPASATQAMQHLAPYATHLRAGGTLTMSDGSLYWDGQKVTLMGISMVGALIAGNLDYAKYLDIMAKGGCNLTRVWVIEQWTALGATVGFPPGYENGIHPFTGSYTNHDYDLSQLNNAFFTHLRDFVRAAGARGIVVQLTLTDRCGLQVNLGVGGWLGSPYNDDNNVQDYLTDPAGSALPAFLGIDGTPIGAVNRALFERIALELRDEGNVIYEIMNEPYYFNGRWAAADVVTFHQWTADVVAAALAASPASVAIHLGPANTEDGLALTAGAATTAATMGGRICRTNASPQTNLSMPLAVSDAYAWQGNRTEQYVTIHYYDTGSGALAIEYDGGDGIDPAGIYTSAGSVSLTGANLWRRHTWHITDAWLGNRQAGGGDLRITGSPTGGFYIESVEVRPTAPPPVPPVPVIQAVPTTGTAPLQVTFGASGSYDPDGGTIASYDWSFGDGSPHDSSPSPTHTYTLDQSFVATLKLIDNQGASDTASVTIVVTRQLCDYDLDGDVDESDFGVFQRCLATESTIPPGCESSNLNGIEGIDGADVAIFLNCFGGPNRPPGC